VVILHLGVNDVIYPARFTVKRGEVTTGQVAERLEKTYGIMGFFADSNGQSIADEAVQTYLDVLSGKDTRQYGESLTVKSIKSKFTNFIDSKAMDGKTAGVPTKASLLGKSKKLKRSSGPIRPSFKDSWLYEDNFRAWIDTK